MQKTIHYRYDIQGIRAIGAVLVLIFHIWFNKVSGGVDVFFVVSGFLMTTLLLRMQSRLGRIHLRQFWNKIIKRIAPTAYIVLVTTALASYFLLPAPLLREFTNELLASALFTQNFHLMGASVDYLDASLPASPVQQFWALSVQVQFLIALPLLMIALQTAGKLSYKMFNPTQASAETHNRRWLALGFSALALASFAYALQQVQLNAVTAYYNTLARGWEFLLGALLCLLAPSLVQLLTSAWRLVIALSGLLLLFGGAFLLPDGAAFPGLPALVPVTGALCLLAAGFNGGSAVSRALSHPALQFLGGISFTLYLWHWPVLIFYQHFTHNTVVSFAGGALIIALAFIFSWFTHQLLEQPLRTLTLQKRRHAVAMTIAFLVPLALSVASLRYHVLHIHHQFEKLSASRMKTVYQGGILQPSNNQPAVTDLELAAAREYLPEPYRRDCHQNRHNPAIESCQLGDPDGDYTIVLAGSSHAAQWAPALHLLGLEHGVELVTITKSYCTLGALEDADPSCLEWNNNIIEHIIALKPELVITPSTRFGEQGERIAPRSIEQWQALHQADIEVVGIRGNPRFSFDPTLCLSHYHQQSLKCSVPRQVFFQADDPAKAYSDLITPVDMTHIFCSDNVCPTSYDGYLMYSDEHHLHVPYVRYMRRELAEELAESLGRHSPFRLAGL